MLPVAILASAITALVALPPAPVAMADTAPLVAVVASEPSPTAPDVPDDAVAVDTLAAETSNTFVNPDGSYTSMVAPGPINYQDDSGIWEPISNELAEAPGAAYAVENEADSYSVSIPENPSTTPAKFETNDAWVTMKMAGSDAMTPAVDGTEATFEDLTPAADEVMYQATDTGAKETITLDAAPSASVAYVFNLQVNSGVKRS